MRLTDEVVSEFGITTVMVTHSMRQALDFGSRMIMLHQGRVMLESTGRSAVDGRQDLFTCSVARRARTSPTTSFCWG